jgi:hypothetical protein
MPDRTGSQIITWQVETDFSLTVRGRWRDAMPQSQAQPPAKLHFRQQEAAALLDPVRIELHQIQSRLDHYLERLHLSEGDTERLAQAREAIEAAAARVGALQAEASIA